MGSWQRSVPMFHKAAEIVRNGLIGTVTHVEVGLPGGNSDFDDVGKEALAKLAASGQTAESLEQIVAGTPAWDLLVSDPPKDLDYEMWIGPSKMEPYMQAAFPQILALELQHGRRRASGLDRASLRYCTLGSEFRQLRSVGG